MVSLYLDTSSNFKIGLLDKNYSWIEFKSIETKRTSEIIHEEIHKLLEAADIKVKDIAETFLLSGPGSYTGMRVAEGVGQIFELEDLKVYSFTIFHLAELAKKSSYLWIYEAFKGEFYLRDMKGQESFVKVSEFIEDEVEYLSHGASKIAGLEVTDMTSFIQNHPQEVFNYVKSKELRDGPFYFRPVDVEFKKSTK